ncbi:MAG: LPS assembly lipoprotein LptE [Pseudomonadota bacterium]
MWLSDRRKFLALGAAAAMLTGCGYTPVYGPGAASSKLRDAIFIPKPSTEDLFQIVQHFEQKMGRADEKQAAYRLNITASKSLSGLGATATGGTTRFHWTGTLTYSLTDPTGGQTFAQDTIQRFTGYSATVNTAATLASERDAARRLMLILTDAMIDQLLQIDPATLP